MIRIDHLDHLVLTVADIDATCAFYETALGMSRDDFGPGKTALVFGEQKFNLHQVGRELKPNAARAAPGTADFCLISCTPLDEAIAHLLSLGIAIELGPVERTGAIGSLRSIYFRDPDGNLIEVANPD
jgi:catechol 2,3-dioxygenase-like lactoylglutathione lyase family enzyme